MHMVMGQLESVGVKVLEDFTDCVKVCFLTCTPCC